MKEALLILVLVAMAVPATAKPKDNCGGFECRDMVIVKVPKRKMDNEKTVIVVPRGTSLDRKAFCKAFICGDVYVVGRKWGTI